jgi:hypothetical protein
MITVDKTLEQPKDTIPAVQMHRDFRSEADNIGGRVYKKGHVYTVTPDAQTEMEAADDVVGALVYIYPRERNRPVFDMVSITSRITQFFTSNGYDTFHLRKGEKCKVPSNLAVFLFFCGYADRVAPKGGRP